MKKILLIALFFTTFGQSHAKEFTAGGMEPFWSLNLKQQHDNQYQAVLSYPNETGITTIEATVERFDHRDYTTYQGQGSNGKPFSIMTAEKPCVSEGKGDTLSHLVIVNGFEGCGGNVLINSDDNEQADNYRNSGQSTHKKTAHEKAKQLNTLGFRLYKQGKYQQALPLFYRASKTDSRYALAQYNLACTAAMIARRNQCFQDEELSHLLALDSITAALKQSIMLDPKRKSKSQTDPDLAQVRQTYPYYRDILHYSPDNDRQLRQMLENINWSQAGGFYPHQGKPARILFDSDSVTTINNKGLQRTGRYSLNNGLITLTFTSENYGRQQITGRLLDNDGTFRGVLRFSGAAKANVLPFDEYTTDFTTPNCNEN